VEDRRLPFGFVRLDHQGWQEIEARFAHKNQGAVFAACLPLQSWPDLGSPAFDLRLITLEGAWDRHRGRPAHTGGFRPVLEEVGAEMPLSWFEFGGVAGSRVRQQRGRASAAGPPWRALMLQRLTIDSGTPRATALSR
jgi:hypothetical protein